VGYRESICEKGGVGEGEGYQGILFTNKTKFVCGE